MNSRKSNINLNNPKFFNLMKPINMYKINNT